MSAMEETPRTVLKMNPSEITAMTFESVLKILKKYSYTIFLFTASDFKTIVVPKTVLGIFNALSGDILSRNHGFSSVEILTRIPLVFLWVWINLLSFNINNQRQPDAVLEDKINKAWRPMPSGRISHHTAVWIMVATKLMAFAFSWYLHVLQASLTLFILDISYNNLGGGDRSCIVRNILNAGLYLGFATGATMVAIGGDSLNTVAWNWLAAIGVTVFLTVHMQDIPDQEGDRVRGRNSVPLVIGDGPARWTIATTMTAASFLLPAFWEMGLWGYSVAMTVGAVVVWRVVAKRTIEDDEVTWKLWNLWMSSLYLLPYFKSWSRS